MYVFRLVIVYLLVLNVATLSSTLNVIFYTNSMANVSMGSSPKAFWRLENLSAQQEQKVDFR